MREISWRPRAVADLDGILTYLVLELKAPKAAKDCSEAIMETVERVADMPTLGRLFSDGDLERSYFRILVKNYWIYYTATGTELIVWRVFHTSQDLNDYGFVFFD